MTYPQGPGQGQGGYQGPPQGGYGGQPQGGWQGPPPPQQGGSSGGGAGPWPWIAGVLVLLLLVGVGAFFVLGGDDDEDGGEVPVADAPGEIFLEPAGANGPEPFSTTPLGQPDSSLATPTTGAPSVSSATTASRTSGGGTPGLYGGTTDATRCDVDQLISFLQGDQAKAQAWVDALNADPQLRFSGGTLTTADIETYVRGLESFVLTSDVRVTNHGFRDGRANRVNSTLQRGHAVLVDEFGMVRVKCYCGNPIISPEPVAGTPRYTGTSWEGFDPTQVTVIQPEPQPVGTFQIRDPQTGQLVPFVFGSGQQPAPSPTASATPSPTATATATSAAPAPTTPAPTSAAPADPPQISLVSYNPPAVLGGGFPPGASISYSCEQINSNGSVDDVGSGTLTASSSGEIDDVLSCTPQDSTPDNTPTLQVFFSGGGVNTDSSISAP